MVKLFKCDCEWEKDVNTRVGEGYLLVTMCDLCKTINAQDVIAQDERKAERDKMILIKEKLIEMAIAELQKEGKL